jgi:hypothetical protein
MDELLKDKELIVFTKNKNGARKRVTVELLRRVKCDCFNQ